MDNIADKLNTGEMIGSIISSLFMCFSLMLVFGVFLAPFPPFGVFAPTVIAIICCVSMSLCGLSIGWKYTEEAAEKAKN